MKNQYPRIPTPSAADLLAIRDGDTGATDRFLRSCEPRITALARSYARRGPDHHELAQDGRIAAWKAAGRYNPERGDLEHYVTRSITNAFKDRSKEQCDCGIKAAPHHKGDSVEVVKPNSNSILIGCVPRRLHRVRTIARTMICPTPRSQRQRTL